MQYQRLGDEGVQLVDESVSLAGPVFLMLGVLSVGGVLLWLTKQGRDDYEEYDSVERVKNVIGDIEAEEPDED